MPRSPRAAVQPEDVPQPRRQRSKRARNPIVIAGNALLTLVFVLLVGAGAGFLIGKQRFDLPGRWPRTRWSTCHAAASVTPPICSSAPA
jgi:UPF0755 protein